MRASNVDRIKRSVRRLLVIAVSFVAWADPVVTLGQQPSNKSKESTLELSGSNEEHLPVPNPETNTSHIRARDPLRYAPQSGGYRLAAGDTLAIIVHGVIGRFGEAPAHFPTENQADLLPATGYPIPILSDGCLHLPQLGPLNVTGLNVVEAQDAIGNAYLDAGITKKQHIVMLSLLRKRKVQAVLVHSKPAGGRVDEVALDADQASVLNAIASGGVYDRRASVRVFKPNHTVGLQGSLIHLQSPAPEFFYTGGLLAGGQHALPSDRPLNVLQAISIAGGSEPRVIPPRRVTIVSRQGGARRFSMREVLANPGRILIMPGDHILVQ